MLLLPLVSMSQSKLYQQYAKRPGLTVANVEGMRLNDSVRVDVTLIQADSPEAWQQLAQEFDVRGYGTVVSWLGTVNNPVQRTKWTGKPVLRVIASHKRQTIAFYHINDETQYDALLDYQLNNIRNR